MKPWSNNHLDELPIDGPFNAMSPFGNFALRVLYDLKVPLTKYFYNAIGKSLDNNEDDLDEAIMTNFEKNPTYSIAFLEYLVENVLVFGCLFDHSLMTLNSIKDIVDTNSCSEAWNKVKIYA